MQEKFEHWQKAIKYVFDIGNEIDGV